VAKSSRAEASSMVIDQRNMSIKPKTQDLCREVKSIPELAACREQTRQALQEVRPVTLEEARAQTAHLRASRNDSEEN
jgi:hypothetical protein